MKQLILKVIKYLTGDWELFYIYKKKIKPLDDITQFDSLNIVQEKITDQYHKISINDNNEQICSLHIIWGSEYKDNFRNYIPLKKNEAKIIDVITSKKYRGKGHIGKLLSFTEEQMLTKDIDTLLARIWHSNESSKRAFEKKDWKYAGFKLKLNLLKKIPLSFTTYK
jgi:hypothetical protein